MTRYVIVGNGVAGTTAAEQIRKLDKDGEIQILTDEDIPFYYRVRLPEFLSGDIGESELLARKEDWYGSQKIRLRLNIRVSGAEAAEKAVITAAGEKVSYERLLLASGSRSFIPPIRGADRSGVFALRSIRDARAIREVARGVESAVIIGGGLLGLEAGHALVRLGKRVTVVEFFPRLLPRQLDPEGARRLQGLMEDMGFSFRLGAKTRTVEGDRHVTGVLLDGGERLSAGMVMISAGVRPDMELAKPLGIDTDKGIKVDERMRTSRADVYAAGDVAEFKGMSYGIWPAAMEQGKVAGANMAGGDLAYAGTVMANTLKVAGVDLASAGEIDPEGKFPSRVMSEGKIYQKIVLDGNRIIGCIMLGTTAGFTRITKAMAEGTDVSQIDDEAVARFLKRP